MNNPKPMTLKEAEQALKRWYDSGEKEKLMTQKEIEAINWLIESAKVVERHRAAEIAKKHYLSNDSVRNSSDLAELESKILNPSQ